ncbi:integrase, catalytic region, zinc finger, CCHC-type containing protein [Tanacetum coccineum]|uniref:Integrase, catalytic region, zinc finger, CCHC-type containing protein n=1 Tax=Tanacetum coccineum TaxID=301880 RepID=A0ABQ5C6D0_9ASTR
MSQDGMICVMNSTAVFDYVNVELQSSQSCVKCLDLNAELLKSQNAYNDLLKIYSQLEKHCISLELTMQLNQEIFQKNSLSNNQNALEIPKYFESNDLKAHLQAKDTTICKLREHIKSIRENDKEEKFKHEMDEIEIINIELEHKHGDSLISQLNSMSVENEDLKHQIQDKVFVITSLKSDLRKLKEKETVENVAQIPIATTIAPGMFKIDLEPLACRLLNNREAHIDYLKHTQEQADILQGIVEQAKAKQPLDNALDFACKHAKRIQELLVYVQDTCPNVYKPSQKLIVVTPMNKVKKVRFYEPLTSSSNIQQGSNATDVPSSSSLVNDRNDQIAKIMRYGDYQLGNVIISRVYYVDGLRHNLFFVGQFCNADLEVAFRKNTCFIRNLEGVDLLSRFRDTTLYTISLDDMLKTSPICLLSKASKTKSWLWHHRLSHLNFGTLKKLAKDGLA